MDGRANESRYLPNCFIPQQAGQPIHCCRWQRGSHPYRFSDASLGFLYICLVREAESERGEQFCIADKTRRLCAQITGQVAFYPSIGFSAIHPRARYISPHGAVLLLSLSSIIHHRLPVVTMRELPYSFVPQSC